MRLCHWLLIFSLELFLLSAGDTEFGLVIQSGFKCHCNNLHPLRHTCFASTSASFSLSCCTWYHHTALGCFVDIENSICPTAGSKKCNTINTQKKCSSRLKRKYTVLQWIYESVTTVDGLHGTCGASALRLSISCRCCSAALLLHPTQNFAPDQTCMLNLSSRGRKCLC